MTDLSVVQTQVRIAAPPDHVADFVTTPMYWPRWHVASVEVTGDIHQPLKPGDRLSEVFRMGFRKGIVDWACVEPEAPWQFAISGSVRSGGCGVIQYQFLPRGGQTEFVRCFSYRMPSAWLRLLDRLIIRRRLASESKRSLAALKRLLTHQNQ